MEKKHIQSLILLELNFNGSKPKQKLLHFIFLLWFSVLGIRGPILSLLSLQFIGLIMFFKKS
jgi:hypothetical protein